MTVSSETKRASYAGDGSTASFSVPFYFLDNTHVTVTLRASDGAETTWVENTQYTLSGAGVAAGGTITVVTSPTDYTPASGETLVVTRSVPLKQETDYVENDPFPAETHEQALDELTMIAQQQQDALDRTPKFSVTSTASGVTFPDPSASAILGWNSGGTDLENKALADLNAVTVPASSTDSAIVLFDGTGGSSFKDSTYTITAAGAALLDDADAAAQRATLSVGGKGSDIASASNITIAESANYFDVTGTTTITGMTVAAGRVFTLQFDGALTLTHGGSLNLPGGANITTAAGDEFTFYAVAADTVRCVGIAPANGVAGKALTTQGDILYHDGSGLARLGPGTSGQVLQTNGAGANPSWEDANAVSSGTWTPVLTFAAPGDLSVSYSTQAGSYRKVGTLVVAQFNILTSSFTHSTASGGLKITGLPFTSATDGDNRGMAVGRFDGITKADYTTVTGIVGSNSTEFFIQISGEGQSSGDVQVGDVPSGGTVRLVFTIFYFSAS